MGEGRGVNRVRVGIPEVKSPLGRPRRRWEVYIKMDLQEVGWGTAWIELIWLRIGGCCKCGNEPSGFIKYGELLD
jgi:hypothetical protein